MWTLIKALRNHNDKIQELHSTKAACLYLWEEINVFKGVRLTKETIQVNLLMKM